MPVYLQFDATRFMQEELCLLCCRDSKQARRDSVDVGLARKSTYKYDNNGKRIAKQPRLSVPGTRFDGTQVCLLIAHNSVYSLGTGLSTHCAQFLPSMQTGHLTLHCCLFVAYRPPPPPKTNVCWNLPGACYAVGLYIPDPSLVLQRLFSGVIPSLDC